MHTPCHTYTHHLTKYTPFQVRPVRGAQARRGPDPATDLRVVDGRAWVTVERPCRAVLVGCRKRELVRLSAVPCPCGHCDGMNARALPSNVVRGRHFTLISLKNLFIHGMLSLITILQKKILLFRRHESVQSRLHGNVVKGENGVGEACKLQRDFLSVCRIGAKPDLSHAVVKRGGEGCSVRAWCGIAAFQDFLPLVCNFVRDVSHGVLPFVRGSAYHKRQR